MTFRRRTHVLLVGSLVFLSAFTASAQIVPSEGLDTGLGGNNVVIGTIYGPSGGRVTRRIQVRLITQTRGARVAMSDDYGNFVFRGVPSGSFSVVIDKEKEFEPFTYVMDVI